MFCVNRADRIVDSIVERNYSSMRGVSGFVEWVIASDPFIVGIMYSKLFPEPDCAILEVFVHPEICDVRAGITVPISVLTTRSSV